MWPKSTAHEWSHGNDNRLRWPKPKHRGYTKFTYNSSPLNATTGYSSSNHATTHHSIVNDSSIHHSTINYPSSNDTIADYSTADDDPEFILYHAIELIDTNFTGDNAKTTAK